MNSKQFRKIRIGVAIFIALIMSAAVSINNIYLGLGAVVTGMIFLILAKRKVKDVTTDERVITIGGEAARLSFSIVTVFLAFFSLIFIFSGRETESAYTEGLGLTLSYLALLNIAVYALSFWLVSKKYS